MMTWWKQTQTQGKTRGCRGDAHYHYHHVADDVAAAALVAGGVIVD